jgi:hypothetical protein
MRKRKIVDKRQSDAIGHDAKQEHSKLTFVQQLWPQLDVHKMMAPDLLHQL